MDKKLITDGVLQRVGQTLNAQITLSWDTAQTLGQYLEIRDDLGEDFDFEDFIEYVLSNSVEQIENEVRFNNKLGQEFNILTGDGKVLY
jgi:hypothetical protein